jgi:hypothetical protein
MDKEIIEILKEDMKKIPALEQNYALLNQKVDYVIAGQDEIKKIVSELNNKPKEHWNTIVTVIITGIVTAALNTVVFLLLNNKL